MLKRNFFDRDACVVAQELLGKVISHYHHGLWLSARIIETEAYYLLDKASHASLGFTEKRKALFMPAGTIYMYYARGGDSFNISCRGKGNAVLLKSAVPYLQNAADAMLEQMHHNNPFKNSQKKRSDLRLCSGQTLLCIALGLRVSDWNSRQFDKNKLRIEDSGYQPQNIICTTRLGIPPGRDEHLPYRFIDSKYMDYCTKKIPSLRLSNLGLDF